jgi:hypothetical protein
MMERAGTQGACKVSSSTKGMRVGGVCSVRSLSWRPTGVFHGQGWRLACAGAGPLTN